MLSSLLLAFALQVGPFYEQRADYHAVRPFWSAEKATTDVLWPVFTSHQDWWRFCWFTHYQENAAGGYQFDLIPLWFNGRMNATADSYWGLFPFYGTHPHFLGVYDLEFCLWPLWHRYRMPRPGEGRWMTSHAVLFPFVSWRDDGSWGVWPVCGVNHQRESDHRYALWPLATWASYREDRDTAGAGHSWMFWPVCAAVRRARETQTMFFPPLFGYAQTPRSWRLRCPYPLVEIERGETRDHFRFFPFYENTVIRRRLDDRVESDVMRFGWRLVELYRGEHGQLEESRVFPFWKGSARHTRVWPFCERYAQGDESWRGILALFPVTWADSVDRNWRKFWTFYESVENPVCTDHSLLWGLIRWRTFNE